MSVETIFLNRGMPSDDICGRDLFELSLQDLSKASNISTFGLLNYGDDEGPLSTRKAVCSFLDQAHAEVVNGSFEPHHPDNMFLSSGNSHALSVLSTMLLHTRSNFPIQRFSVLCDDPTYPFAKLIFLDHGAHLVGVPFLESMQTDVAGMRRACEEARLQGRPVKFAYLIPSFHNPTGSVMPLEIRKQMVALAREFDFFLICDDVYQLLHFPSNEPAPPCTVLLEQKVASADCRVISLGTYSKIFSPSLRCGWIYTHNQDIIAKLRGFGELISGGGFSAMAHRVGEQMINSGRQLQLLHLVQSRLETKCKEMCALTRRILGDYVSFIEPKGGYFLWLELSNKSKMNAEELHVACMALKPVAVKFFAGNIFGESKQMEKRFRLSFALYDVKDFERALTLIAGVLQQ